MVNQKQGVSALGLQRVLGFGSYQTAWAWLHKLRRAMVLPGRELLGGTVEVDESYVGGVKPGRRGRGAAGQGDRLDRGRGPRPLGRAGAHGTHPNVRKQTLTDFVPDHLERGTEVHTDAYGGYDDIGRHRFTHVITDVSASAHFALPHVHRVASLLKRWLLDIHQGAVNHDQLDWYLDEFTFRFNCRRLRHRGLLFYRLIEGALLVDPHPYKALTAD